MADLKLESKSVQDALQSLQDHKITRYLNELSTRVTQQARARPSPATAASPSSILGTHFLINSRRFLPKPNEVKDNKMTNVVLSYSVVRTALERLEEVEFWESILFLLCSLVMCTASVNLL